MPTSSLRVSSNSQWGQDLWVLQLLLNKRNGFFMEIGAGDGLWISNTLILERDFGWKGILVEPTRAFESLARNRPNAACFNVCVASKEKEVTLVEILDLGQAAITDAAAENTLLSAVRDNITPSEAETANLYGGKVGHATKRKAFPLAKIMADAGAPTTVDYFSLDVEGSEYEILKTFPFDRYRFRVLGIEMMKPSNEIHSLMTRHGYVLRENVGHDAMYINPSALGILFQIREGAKRVVDLARRVKKRLRQARPGIAQRQLV